MRLVAGSNPAARTTTPTIKILRRNMGYHDRKPPSYENSTGIGVVNPLLQLQKRLNQIQDVINSLPEKHMSIVELSTSIQKILDGDESE